MMDNFTMSSLTWTYKHFHHFLQTMSEKQLNPRQRIVCGIFRHHDPNVCITMTHAIGSNFCNLFSSFAIHNFHLVMTDNNYFRQPIMTTRKTLFLIIKSSKQLLNFVKDPFSTFMYPYEKIYKLF